MKSLSCWALSAAVLFSALPVRAAKASCASKTAEGEGKLESGDSEGARGVLEEATRLCDADPGETSARPYVALGVAYNNLQDYDRAITMFKKALKKEPTLARAHINLSAAYQQKGQFEKSIQEGKKALGSGDPKLEMQADFNIGLSYYKLAAEKENPADKSAQPWFEKSRKLDPGFGANYFYLGTIKELADSDYPAAKALYKKGCDLKYEQACRFLKTFDERVGPAAAAPARPTIPATGEEKALYKQIRDAYIKKGLDAASADETANSLRDSYSKMPVEQRLPALRSFVKSLQ